jgi:cholesterol oxidase
MSKFNKEMKHYRVCLKDLPQRLQGTRMFQNSIMNTLQYDYIVIGSGFGGSVSAMRLSQKGYKVVVIESGKMWNEDDFADRNWNIRKYLWMPKIGLYGIQRMNFLNNVVILGGAGVGGGSLNYGNTLYIPPDDFFKKDSVIRLGGKKTLLPYYELAKKMLGAVVNPKLTPQDYLLRDTAAEYKREDTFQSTCVGVYFGEEGKKAEDPYFMGEGPERIGCELCGACMTGCKKNAKNTLTKNYLYFARRFGAEILPENKVVDIIPLSEDGEEGYQVETARTTGFFGSLRGKRFTARGIVFSAGTLGTISLLLKLKQAGLKRLPDNIGKMVRTNSEAIIGVRARSGDADYSKGVAITSSVHPDKNTHIEPVRYAKGNDFMGLLAVLITDGGGRIPRLLRYLINIIKHPIDFMIMLNPIGFARKAIILLVMQTHDNYIDVFRKHRLLWPFIKTLTSKQASKRKNPVYIPLANDFGRRLAKRINAIPCSSIGEVYLNAPLTAHIMGGCSIGSRPGDGVIDEQNRVRGYRNMIINDGSQIPENLGVNPALTITALSERAMSFIPLKQGEKFKALKVEKKWKVMTLLNRVSGPVKKNPGVKKRGKK